MKLKSLWSALIAAVLAVSMSAMPALALSPLPNSAFNGQFTLLANQDKDLPSLTNTFNQPITVKIQAEGSWQLASSGSYQKVVDANGITELGADNVIFPQFKPAALLAIIKDKQGKQKSVKSGKEQAFELLSGESVSFIINDDSKLYYDNIGSQKINFTINPLATPCPTDNSTAGSGGTTGSGGAGSILPKSCNDSKVAPEFVLDIPYQGFAKDSPFKNLKNDSDWFYLEDFKDANYAVNTPGASSSIPNVGANSKNAEYWDNVDEDDGKIDGKGSGKDRFLVFNGDTVTFNFDKSLGDFPTDAGIVWTDVHTSGGNFSVGNLTFEAFDASGKSLGAKGPFTVGGDNSTMGGTKEDRFFGVHNDSGISAIKITVPGASQGLEFDHLQYGRKCRN